MPLETTPFDPAKYLDSQDAAHVFIQDALEAGDAGYLAHVIDLVRRAGFRVPGSEALEDLADVAAYDAAKADPGDIV